MNKKIKKTVLFSLFTIPFIGFASACANQQKTNEFADSKTIVVAKEGVQEKFWNQVEEEFKKTDSYKKGFRIQYVEKDVFSALDHVITTGFNDQNSPDLIYAPQDRITNLLQNKAIKKWDSNIKEEILSSSNATEEEKSFINSFGSFKKITEDEAHFYNFAHNKEAIVLMTKKPLEEVKKDFSNEKTDEMVELVENGKAFFRIQDGWYGNGILGGVLSSDEIKKIIYKKEDGQWSSGFIKNDKHYEKFKQIIDIAAELIYPIYNAGFVLTEEEYKKNPFAEKGITQSDLQTLLQSDMSAVQNKIVELISSGKLEYAMVGSWDIGATSKQGINTYLNFPKLKNNHEYKQASGSWSWTINARNNGVSQERTTALYDLLKIIFKTDSYLKYFESDTKIPLFTSIQNEMKKKIDQDNSTKNSDLDVFAKSANYTDWREFLNEYDNLFSGINKFLDKTIYSYGSWEQTQSKTPLADENLINAKDKFGIKESNKEIFNNIGIKDETFNSILNLEWKKTTGLRNAIAALLKIDDITKLKGEGDAGESWQVAKTLIKDDVAFDKQLLVDDKTTSAHIRKIEKYIFGVNGDNKNEVLEFIEELKKTDFSKILDKIKTKAKEFSNKYAKDTVADDEIEKATSHYLANYYNQAIWEKAKESYFKEWETIKFKQKDKTKDTDKTITEVITLVNTYRSANIAQKIISVLTSDKTLKENGYGIIQYQDSRLDNANPQFGGAYWDLWNNQILGNAASYQQMKTTIKTLDELKKAFADKFDKLYSDKVSALNSSNSEDFISD
ncbi:type 2 periplasmic-binding domain-containing protein [Mesomycoplasma neurolyticum]|uniref:Maltose-binding periplasmic proteins/domains n=1 Tax=Mesomycoplasma neurolyticum TaxID=2120 RepID=A0A449A5A5_9BACT|nr:hypothetical protein [Mesomycoplasma neurolyticum]VEU59409.1 Uncharacterised protein [Mesomycoplasma neurolyticum]